MKKLLKLAGLAAMLAALFFVFGCDDGNDDKTPEGDGSLLTGEFVPYYFLAGDHSVDGADNTVHFRNGSDHSVGIEIEKIYVSPNKSLTGANLLWDFTSGTPGVEMYWGFSEGTTTVGKWSSGEIAARPDADNTTYITGFGSAAFFAHTDSVYWIFVAKNLSDTVKGDDIIVDFGTGSPFTSKFAGKFSEIFSK